MSWLKYLGTKQRRRFYILTVMNLVLFIGGIIMFCMGHMIYIIVVVIPITYIGFYDSARNLADILKDGIDDRYSNHNT